MKKIILCLTAACLSMVFIPGELKASPDSLKTQNSSQSAESEILIKRLEEINSLDRSMLSRSEKKALRKEVRSIDRQLSTLSGGIYLSVGTIIIILILLIIFL